MNQKSQLFLIIRTRGSTIIGGKKKLLNVNFYINYSMNQKSQLFLIIRTRGSTIIGGKKKLLNVNFYVLVAWIELSYSNSTHTSSLVVTTNFSKI
jgi:hypothetical protein